MKTTYEILNEFAEVEDRAKRRATELLNSSATGWRAEAIEKLGGRIEAEYPSAVRVDDNQLYLDTHHVSVDTTANPSRQLKILEFACEIVRRRIAGAEI